ncbi:MAG: hypothetical protein JKY15_01920 [Deltaproteobacteria bacterium]|nr:hypothetical protein [Deltaproteobacteria bacterium]
MMTDLDAKLIPLSKHIRILNNNPRTKLSDRQEKHVDIITEELSILSQDLGIDMVIYTIQSIEN